MSNQTDFNYVKLDLLNAFRCKLNHTRNVHITKREIAFRMEKLNCTRFDWIRSWADSNYPLAPFDGDGQSTTTIPTDRFLASLQINRTAVRRREAC